MDLQAFKSTISFRTQTLERRWQEEQRSRGQSLHLHLSACATAWVALRLLHLPGQHCVASRLALAPLLLLCAHTAAWSRLPGGAPEWISRRLTLAAFGAAWLLPLLEPERPDAAALEVSRALPGRAVALLAVLLDPAAAEADSAAAHGGALAAVALAGVWLHAGVGKGPSEGLAAMACIPVYVIVIWWGRKLQERLESAHRKLWLIRYRAASKAQQFRLVLGCLLPPQIVEPYYERCMRFEAGGLLTAPIAQRIHLAGVLFMAIDAFPEMTVACEPMQLLEFLNNLFTQLDGRCERDGSLMKIETVGEVYVAASGVFGGGADIPALAKFALWSQRTASESFMNVVKLRMGIHAGPLVAGIIGDKLPRYRLFGDTMNTAARLEQHSPPGGLLASSAAAELARADPTLTVAEKGTLPMKGLGEVQTFCIDQAPSKKVCFDLMLDDDLAQASPGSVHRSAAGSDSPATTDSSPNLTSFLKSLPELGTWEEVSDGPSTAGGLLSARSAAVSATPRLPSKSPVWDHLRHGLMDPYSLEAECCEEVVRDEKRPLSPPRRPLTAGKSHPLSGTALAAKPATPGSWLHPAKPKGLPPKTPTAWLSPGYQLTSERRRRAPTPHGLPLPTVEEGEPDAHPDDPSDTQLEELRRTTEAACCWRPAPLVGSLRLQDPCEEQLLCEERAGALQAALAYAALCVGGVALLTLAAEPTWAPAPPAWLEVGGGLLAACLAAALAHPGPGLWALAHAAPVALAWVLALCLRAAPRAALELAVWSLAALAVHMELPCSSVLAPAAISGALLSGAPLDAAALGHAWAVFGLVLVSFVQESLCRRCFASERLNTNVVDRLVTVGEDLVPPSVLLKIRAQRFGRSHNGGPGPRQAAISLVADEWSSVTVMQTDLVGFTALSRTLQPEEVLRMLNNLFVVFDRAVGEHDVFKMETVGDAYICATGLLDFGGGEHRPQALLHLAISLHEAVSRYREEQGVTLGLRAGLHSGRAIGGVVGTTMQRYHLFGGTMHVTESLEATAPSGAVHISDATRVRLQASGEDAWLHKASGERLLPEPVAVGSLTTSKGERVPQCDVGGRETYVVWPPRGAARERH